jgi:hypothetical protein
MKLTIRDLAPIRVAVKAHLCNADPVVVGLPEALRTCDGGIQESDFITDLYVPLAPRDSG